MPITNSARREKDVKHGSLCYQSGAPPTIDAKVESRDIELALNLMEQSIDGLQATISALWTRLAPITDDTEAEAIDSAVSPCSGLCSMSRRIYAAAHAVAASSSSLDKLYRMIQL